MGIGEKFVERRDVQIALETLTNTITAILGLKDATQIVDEMKELEEEDDSPPSCWSIGDDDIYEETTDDYKELDSLNKPEITDGAEKTRKIPIHDSRKAKNKLGGGKVFGGISGGSSGA